MAQYKGTATGNRGSASRLGSKSSGMMTECNGWNLGATCQIEFNEKKGRDEVSVYITKGSNTSTGTWFIGTFAIDPKSGETVQVKHTK